MIFCLTNAINKYIYISDIKVSLLKKAVKSKLGLTAFLFI